MRVTKKFYSAKCPAHPDDAHSAKSGAKRAFKKAGRKRVRKMIKKEE
jgi:hypothetical protein